MGVQARAGLCACREYLVPMEPGLLIFSSYVLHRIELCGIKVFIAKLLKTNNQCIKITQVHFTVMCILLSMVQVWLRSTTHIKFDQTGVRIHGCHITDRISHVPEMLVLMVVLSHACPRKSQ